MCNSSMKVIMKVTIMDSWVVPVFTGNKGYASVEIVLGHKSLQVARVTNHFTEQLASALCIKSCIWQSKLEHLKVSLILKETSGHLAGELPQWRASHNCSSTALLHNKDGINDFPFSSGYNVVASQPDESPQ